MRTIILSHTKRKWESLIFLSFGTYGIERRGTGTPAVNQRGILEHIHSYYVSFCKLFSFCHTHIIITTSLIRQQILYLSDCTVVELNTQIYVTALLESNFQWQICTMTWLATTALRMLCALSFGNVISVNCFYWSPRDLDFECEREFSKR